VPIQYQRIPDRPNDHESQNGRDRRGKYNFQAAFETLFSKSPIAGKATMGMSYKKAWALIDDFDFPRTYRLELVAGRDFDAKTPSDSNCFKWRHLLSS
jgi:hypothetical protein